MSDRSNIGVIVYDLSLAECDGVPCPGIYWYDDGKGWSICTLRRHHKGDHQRHELARKLPGRWIDRTVTRAEDNWDAFSRIETELAALNFAPDVLKQTLAIIERNWPE